MKNLIGIYLLLLLSLSSFTVEIADTPQKRALGLMGRKEMEDDKALLFILPQKQFISLWMYNVYFDLEAAFLDEKGVIQEIVFLKAYPNISNKKFFIKNQTSSKSKVKYVLEAKVGFFNKENLKIGSKIDINY